MGLEQTLALLDFTQNGTTVRYGLKTKRETYGPMDQRQLNDWDAVDACLECIVSCSIDDGECVETCVRIHLGEDEELWASSLCL